MDLEKTEFRDNKGAQKFELLAAGKRAFIDYSDQGDKLILLHTEVPEELEGKGFARALVEQTFQHLETEGRKIIPACSYVRTFLRRYPDWERIVAK